MQRRYEQVERTGGSQAAESYSEGYVREEVRREVTQLREESEGPGMGRGLFGSRSGPFRGSEWPRNGLEMGGKVIEEAARGCKWGAG